MLRLNNPISQQFRHQLQDGGIIVALKTLTVIAVIVAFYFQDMRILFGDALNDESTSYILVIPIIFAYLLFRKRKMLRATISIENSNRSMINTVQITAVGVLVCTLAILLYWQSAYTFTPLEYQILTMPIFVTGLILILFNLQTLRQTVFPILFLAFLTPPPSELLYSFGSTLSVISSEASAAIANVFGINATVSYESTSPIIHLVRQGNISMDFAVDIACSGIYSLMGFLIFAVFVAYIVRDKPWKKIMILILGLPLIYLLNILRITTILLIGYQWGEQLALDVFHMLGGWMLIFIGTLFLLVTSEKLLRAQIFPKQGREHIEFRKIGDSSTIRFHKADVLKIVAILLSVMLLASAQAPVFAITKGPMQPIIQTSTGEEGNTEILPNMAGYSLSFLYRDTGFEEKAKQDASLVYLYTPDDQSWQTVWVAVEVAQSTSSLHHWEYCLVDWATERGLEPGVTQLELKDVQILANPPMVARYFGFQHHSDNQTQLVLYWYETSTFTINNVTQQEHVKISLIAYPQRPEDIQKIETQLQPMAEAIANYWQPLKTLSFISAAIAQLGIPLVIILIGLIVALVAFNLFELAKRANENKNIYQKLSKSNQQLVDAIHEAERTSIATLENIRQNYEKIACNHLSKSELQEQIIGLQQIGIIGDRIINNLDNPIHAWTLQTRFGLGKR
ncbi:MAG: exosortase/archaeosortase family protein [Candidatus Bathyarchaeia archaeon]